LALNRLTQASKPSLTLFHDGVKHTANWNGDDSSSLNDEKLSIFSCDSTLSDNDRYSNGLASYEISQDIVGIISQTYDIPAHILEVICPTLCNPRRDRSIRSSSTQCSTKTTTPAENALQQHDIGTEITIKVEETDELPQLETNNKCICNSTHNDYGDLASVLVGCSFSYSVASVSNMSFLKS
jgi:hypothetical protein